jgi:hypothetical protein
MVTCNYVSSGGVTPSDKTQGTYFWIVPARKRESDPAAVFKSLIRSDDLIIHPEIGLSQSQVAK